MGRRKGQNRKNPPQIKVFAEGVTEIIYLNALRNNIGIKDNIGFEGKSVRKQGLDLYHHVSNLFKNHDFEFSPIDIILIVDKDNTEIEKLIKLEELCRDSNFNLVFSNICFELWLLLHFESVTRYMEINDLARKLSQQIGKKYSKTDKRTIGNISKQYKVALSNSTYMKAIKNDFSKNPYTNVNVFLEKFFNINK
ncbi:TPA: RloB family protein [Streptococcus suis]